MTTQTMKGLYAQLASIGIKKSFASRVLPDWWDDEAATTPSGMQQAQLYMARAFNLDIASLNDDNASPRFRQVEHKFKLQKDATEDKVTASAHFATAMARLALTATETPYQSVPTDPEILRNLILADHEAVTLPALLAYCQSAGIPVLHAANMPGPKMTALAIRLDDRFTIVLSKKGHPANQLFYLAHELGHIARGHLEQDGFLADEKIGDSDDDADEKEADAYAIRLLNGGPMKFRSHESIRSGLRLCELACASAKKFKIDPGHIILNYGHSQSEFKVANAALNHLPVTKDGARLVNDFFLKTINPDRLSDDQLDLLRIAMDYQ